VLTLLVLAAVTVAALGAGLGGWLGWRGAPPLPDDATAAALARTVVPRGTPEVIERRDALFGYRHAGSGAWLVGGDGYSGGYVKMIITDGDEAPDELTEIRSSLLLDRWRLSSDLSGPGYSGAKRRMSVTVYPATLSGDRLPAATAQDAVVIEFGRAEPSRVPTFVVIGYLLGLAVGWFAAALLASRSARRWPVMVAGVLGLVLLLPGTVLTTGQLVWTLLFIPGSMPNPPSWGLYLLPGVRALSVIGVLLMLAALAGALPREREPYP
jgi:hypothetical protein